MIFDFDLSKWKRERERDREMYSADNDNVDDDDAVCRRWMKEEEETMNFKTFDRSTTLPSRSINFNACLCHEKRKNKEENAQQTQKD